MKAFITLIVLISNMAYAQSYEKRSCYDDLMYEDGTSNTTDNIGLTSGMFTAGMILAQSPLVIIPASVAVGNFIYTQVKGGQINRVMRIIEQSENKINNPESETSKLLARTVRKINRKSTEQITELEFARMIDKANKERTLCAGGDLLTIAKMKRKMKNEGTLFGEERTLTDDLQDLALSRQGSSNKPLNDTESVIIN